MTKIGIVGAGMAGLSCAEMLVQHGLDVEILDRHDFVGGRCSTIRQKGYVIDQGAQVFSGRYLRTKETVKRLGLDSSCIDVKLPFGYLRRGRIYNFSTFSFFSHFHPFQFLNFDIVSWKTRYQITKFTSQLWAEKNQHLQLKDQGSLSEMTIFDFVASKYSPELYYDLIEPCLTTWILKDPKNLSAAYALSYLQLFSASPWTPMGGMGYPAEKLSKKVRNVRLENHVSDVDVGERSINLKYDKKESKYDFVVLATDAHDAADLLPWSDVKKILRQILYSPALLIITALDRRPERIAGKYGLFSPRKEGHPFSMVINSASKFIGNVPPRGTALHWMIDKDQAPDAFEDNDSHLEQFIDHEARALFLDYSKPQFVKILRWPRARVNPEPSNLDVLKQIPKQVTSRLFLAGSYFHSLGVEGAILSGRDTAYRILDELKKAT